MNYCGNVDEAGKNLQEVRGGRMEYLNVGRLEWHAFSC
jgi:hypothetical protein